MAHPGRQRRRFPTIRGRLWAVAAAVVVLAGCAAAPVHPLVGPARVIDANTLEIAGERIELQAIRAPERLHDCKLGYGDVVYPCGVFAAHRLAEIVAGQEVRCEPRGRGRWRRVTAVCRVEGEDLGERLVREGWALAHRRSGLDYVAAEEEARDGRRGMWLKGTKPRWWWRRLGQGGGEQM